MGPAPANPTTRLQRFWTRWTSKAPHQLVNGWKFLLDFPRLGDMQQTFNCIDFKSHSKVPMSTAHKRAIQHRKISNPKNLAFVQSAIVPAQRSEETTGVPASITIAQAILESGWGDHHIGGANNYFGVKAQSAGDTVTYGDVASGYVDVPTREVFGGKSVIITAHFRSYKSMTESFIDHGLFLKINKRYQSIIVAYAKDRNADAFADGLQKAGYATDPSYAKLLKRLMKKYDLYKYNSVVAASDK
jgi:flagellum-specific peptidoglycan hydrolase FlgJ